MVARALLDETKDQTAARPKLRRRLKEWRGGGAIERAWRNLHSAEILLAEVVGLDELSSQRPAVISMAKRVLPSADARALAIQDRLSDTAWKDAHDGCDARLDRKLRREYVAALTWVHDACDKNFTRVRSFRNIVLATTAGLFLVAIGLGIVGALNARSLPLCFDAGTRTIEDVRGQDSPTTDIVCPTGAQRGPTGGDVPLVLVVGLAAGAFAAALAVRGMRGTSTPYGVPVAIALLKLPAGALTVVRSAALRCVHSRTVRPRHPGPDHRLLDRLRLRPAGLHPAGGHAGSDGAQQLTGERSAGAPARVSTARPARSRRRAGSAADAAR